MIDEIPVSAVRPVSICGIYRFLGIGVLRQCLNMRMCYMFLHILSIHSEMCACISLDRACFLSLRLIPLHLKLGGLTSEESRAPAGKCVN